MADRVGQPHALIGRENELAAARDIFASGRHSGILLVGEPGVGKTSLARAILDDLCKQSDHHMLWLVASASGTSIPFGAFAPFVPEIGGKAGRQPDPFYLLQTLRKAVVARAEGLRLVLGVDDAHRLDGPSATLLFQLVASEGALAVVAARAHANTAEAVRALWKDGILERFDLDPLGREDSVRVAVALLQEADGKGARPQSVGGELAEALWRVSGGNPLYLRELVLVGCQSGRIVPDRGTWRLVGELAVGPRLTELLQERLGHLGDDELAALEIVAFADSLPLSVLSKLVTNEQVSYLQREGLLKSELSQDTRLVRTAHPLYAEAIRAAIPVTRAMELSGLLADAFEAAGRLDADMLRIVSWRLDAGGQPAPDLVVSAALRAAERQDWELSRRLAEAAVSAGAGPGAVFALADAMRTLGRYTEALAVLGDLTGDGDDEVARVAVLRAFSLFWGLNRAAEAIDGLAEAATRIHDVSHRTWVEGVRAGLLIFMGRPVEGVATARPLVDRPGLSPRTEITVRSALSMGLALTGRVEEAIRVAEGCLTDELLGDAGSVSTAWTLSSRAVAYRLSGRLSNLEDLANEQYQLALQLNNRPNQGSAAGALGWVALPRGELDAAIAHFREAASLLEKVDPIGARIPAFGGLAEALAVTGDIEGAIAALNEAAGPGPLTDHPRLAIASAWVAAAQGEVTRALAQLAAAAAAAQDTGQISYELLALSAMVRLGSPEVAERLAELDAWVEGPLVKVVAAHAAALAAPTGTADALDEVTERYASLTFNLYAAEAAAQASRAHGLTGQARRAAASAARAHFLLGSHQGPRPVGLSVALTPPGLTRREQEVAMLAVRGLSSQAIATTLHLSVRTIETHLARVYYKLGISGRSHLSRALAVNPGLGPAALAMGKKGPSDTDDPATEAVVG